VINKSKKKEKEKEKGKKEFHKSSCTGTQLIV